MDKPMSHEETLVSRVVVLADGLRAWFRMQEYVEMFGMPEALEPTRQNIVDYSFALTEELHEFARELHWRPWHNQAAPIDKQKALKEYGDMMAFMGLLGIYLMNLVDCTPDQIADSYFFVSLENLQKLLTKRGLDVPKENG